MGFPHDIAERALLDSGRHCCLCHKFCGFKIELHHIKQPKDGGDDSYENCIPLCFDCHAEVKAYDPKHPKGRKLTESELRGHRDRWYEEVSERGGILISPAHSELDKKLFLEIRSVLPSAGSISFIRHHDYGNRFPSDQHADLDRFLKYCESPEFEFIDVDLEGIRAKLAEHIAKFLEAIACSSYKLYREMNLVCGAQELKEFDRFFEVVNTINKLAENICTNYDVLIRIGRRKLEV